MSKEELKTLKILIEGGGDSEFYPFVDLYPRVMKAIDNNKNIHLSKHEKELLGYKSESNMLTEEEKSLLIKLGCYWENTSNNTCIEK